MSTLRLLLPLLLVLPITTPRLEAGGNLPVTGEAMVLVTPDLVIVTLGIEVRESSLVNAHDQFEGRAKEVSAAITALGIPPEQVRTDCLEIAPYYHDRTTQERLVPEYFRINRVLAVTLKDPKQVDSLVSAALTAGATHVLDVDFRTTDLRKHRDEARRLALKAAKEKATLLTGELGHRLGRVQAIDEGSYGWQAYNSYRQRYNTNNYSYQSQNIAVSAGGGASGDILVPPGQIAVSANVRVTFEFD